MKNNKAKVFLCTITPFLSLGMQKTLEEDYKTIKKLIDSRCSTHLNTFLMKNKICMNAFSQTFKSASPLHYAIACNHIESVRVILHNTGCIEARDFCGWRPLHEAAMHNNTECIKLLLQGKAEINAQTFNGSTPLHVAVWYSKKDAVQMLLTYKANSTIKNRGGCTPCDLVGDATIKNLFDSYTS
jgi:ankyrin repeat protein